MREVSSHRCRNSPAATTSDATAKAPHSDSPISARRAHHTERHPRPVATAATSTAAASASSTPTTYHRVRSGASSYRATTSASQA